MLECSLCLSTVYKNHTNYLLDRQQENNEFIHDINLFITDPSTYHQYQVTTLIHPLPVHTLGL